MTTVTLPRTKQIATQARTRISTELTDEVHRREIGLMLGLYRLDNSGKLVDADPWDVEIGNPEQLAAHLPNMGKL